MWLEYQISSMKYYIYMNKTAFLYHVQLQQIIAQNMNIIECSTKLFKTCLIEIGSQYAISQEFIATNLWKSTGCLWKYNNFTIKSAPKYHTSVELCTWFVLCCVLLRLGNSPIISPQGYFTGTVGIILWLCNSQYAHVIQDYFTATGTIIWLPQWQWSNPDKYANEYMESVNQIYLEIIDNIITTKQSTTKLLVYFLECTVGRSNDWTTSQSMA